MSEPFVNGTPDFTEQPSTSLTYRGTQRVDRLTQSVRATLVNIQKRPNPPRGVRTQLGGVRWNSPAPPNDNITHYRVYANSESNLVRSIPVDQLYLQDNLVADRAFVSAFNESSGLESAKVLVNGPIGERRNIEDFAPTPESADLLGDGNSHLLSTLYATLSDAQVKYPFVTSLNWEAAAAALQLGINYLSSIGGGALSCKRGTYLIYDITLRQLVWIDGDGFGATIFFMPDGRDADMFKSDGFDSLYPTIASHTDPSVPGGSTPDLTMGIWGFGIQGVTLDGNRANNSSGSGFKIYGWNYSLQNLRVHDFARDGLVTGWADAGGAPSWTDLMEARFTDLKIHHNGGRGWSHNGPHDSVIDKVEVYENAGDVGFYEGRNGASYYSHFHSYGPAQLIAARFDEVARLTKCTFETAQGVQLQANAGLIGDCLIFSSAATSGLENSLGLQIGQVLDATPKTIIGITGGGGSVLIVQFSASHNLFTNNQLAITGVVGIAAANYGAWVVTKIDATHVSLQFSESATGTYTSGGSAIKVAVPNGFNLKATIFDCGGGLIGDTAFATGGGNTFAIDGYQPATTPTPLVFSAGTNVADYAAQLKNLFGADLDIWINGDVTKPLSVLHLRSMAAGVIQTVGDVAGIGPSMSPPSSDNGFISAHGLNARFDPLVSKWRTANSGTANGGAALALDPGASSARFILIPSTGAAVNQQLTPSQFIALTALYFDSTPEATLFRNLILQGTDGSEIALRLKGSSGPSSSHPFFNFARHSSDTLALLYGQTGVSTFINFLGLDIAASQVIHYVDVLIKSGVKFVFEDTGKALDYSTLAASRFVKLDSAREFVTGKLDPTDDNDIDVSGLTDGQFVKRDGSGLASGLIVPTLIDWSGLTSGEALTPSGSGITTIPGISTSGTMVTSVSFTTDTIDIDFVDSIDFVAPSYTTSNLLQVVVTSVTVTDVPITFSNGLWVS